MQTDQEHVWPEPVAPYEQTHEAMLPTRVRLRTDSNSMTWKVLHASQDHLMTISQREWVEVRAVRYVVQTSKLTV